MPAPKKIRVLVVDDSSVARNIIARGLSSNPQIEVVGYAINTMDARIKYERLKPDVMTMDVEMPGQSGLDFLKVFLPDHPIPVVMVSSLDLKVFDALSVGAVSFVRKPEPGKQGEFIDILCQQVLAAASSKVRPVVSLRESPPISPPLGRNGAHAIIGLGASTGGTEATLEVLKRLPADIPGMLIVQHMPVGFTEMYAQRLNRLCRMEVREAKAGDEIRRGLALIAPADYQMRVVRAGSRYTVSCMPGERVSGHRPSVDVLFRSMADTVTVPMVGIIMTGMGQDGADGLLAMRKRGAYTIGQDQESSVVYGMPGVAMKIGAVTTQASCTEIAQVLLRHLKSI